MSTEAWPSSLPCRPCWRTGSNDGHRAGAHPARPTASSRSLVPAAASSARHLLIFMTTTGDFPAPRCWSPTSSRSNPPCLRRRPRHGEHRQRRQPSPAPEPAAPVLAAAGSPRGLEFPVGFGIGIVCLQPRPRASRSRHTQHRPGAVLAPGPCGRCRTGDCWR